MSFAPQRRALFRDLNFQKWSEPLVFLTFWLPNVLRATTACTFSTSQLPKVVRHWGVLYILTWKCASRHNGVHFFNVSTSKMLRTPQFLTHVTSKCASRHNAVHFFQHLNFQKWSDAEVFCTFSLRNRLRATTACNFSSLISTDVSAPATLASLLFNPPEPQNHEKTQCFATFLPFRAPASSFFWSCLFWLFSLLTAFSSLHIVGSLTSKLPSINITLVLAYDCGRRLLWWCSVVHYSLQIWPKLTGSHCMTWYVFADVHHCFKIPVGFRMPLNYIGSKNNNSAGLRILHITLAFRIIWHRKNPNVTVRICLIFLHGTSLVDMTCFLINMKFIFVPPFESWLKRSSCVLKTTPWLKPLIYFRWSQQQAFSYCCKTPTGDFRTTTPTTDCSADHLWP